MERHLVIRRAPARPRARRRYLGIALVLLVGPLAGRLPAQDALWVGTLGTDTAVVEGARRAGSRITGTIVNVAAGLLVQRYEAELRPDGTVQSLRAWLVRDLEAPVPPDAPPSTAIVIDADSIRVTRMGRDGQPQVSAIPAVAGTVPIFDAFFDNPMALMDLALRQAARRGDGKVRIYYVGSPQVDELTLEGAATGEVAFPYVLARQYPMLSGARLRAKVDAGGLAQFDARETTFKIVTVKRPWSDPLALARDFKERGLGAGGFSTMSPARKASGRIGSVDIAVTYGQPSRRGRRIFPDVLPFGEVWRAGANAATQVTFSGDVVVDGRPVPAGSYSLWVIPGERTDTLIINKAARVWGVMYDAQQDLVRVPLRRDRPAEPVEALTYTIVSEGARGRLELAWDDRRFSVVVEPAAGGQP